MLLLRLSPRRFATTPGNLAGDVKDKKMKKWFVSYVVKPRGQEHKTLHAFIEGDDVEEELTAYIYGIKELMKLETEEITVLSVSLV